MFADFWHGHLQSSLSAVSSHIVSIIPGYDVMTVESEWLIFRIGACRYLALFVLAMPVAAPAQEIDVYPPPPPRVSPVAGAIDFHVHSGPDVFGRGLLDSEVAAAAARAGMRGLVLKNHVTSTADRAYLVMRSVPGIEVFGGIVLNGAVGGINPVAVEWMHRMEGGRGKVVWLPTFEAAAHIAVFGGPERGLVAADSGHGSTGNRGGAQNCRARGFSVADRPYIDGGGARGDSPWSRPRGRKHDRHPRDGRYSRHDHRRNEAGGTDGRLS